VLALDQASKRWAVAELRGRSSIDLIDGLLSLSYAENPGIAFSLFNSGDMATRWILAGVSTAAMFILTWYLARTNPSAVRLQATFALLLGGVAGNLVDRIVIGRVVDFIDVYYGAWHWPTFNIADSAISVGAALLALELLKSDAKQAVRNEA
jgi:signal peptidase II